MDIKERLNGAKIIFPSQRSAKLILNTDKKEVFCDGDDATSLISDAVNSMKNIIFVCNRNCDRDMLSKKFRNCVRRKVIIKEPFSEKDYSHNSINIIPNADGDKLVSVLESAISGTKSFVLFMSLNSYENVITKLKTLTSLNSGLNENSVNVMFAAADFVLVNVTYEYGKYLIKSIDGMEFSNSVPELKNIYTFTGEISAGRTLQPEYEDYDNNPETQSASGIEERKEGLIESRLRGQQPVVAEYEKNVAPIASDVEKNAILSEFVSETEDDNENKTEITNENKQVQKYPVQPEIKQEVKVSVTPEPKIEAPSVNNVTEREAPVQPHEEAKHINKYKLLREKLRKRRNASQDNFEL